MGSLKALQEWCRLQCEGYSDVDIRNMASSFRDGLAFCAIIHRHRPDLIDFDSLTKENVYDNNRMAFEVAEVELGIPALLDPEDMVSMKVPDRLSIITYVSQYYNFFTNKSNANPPCMKRPSGTGHSEPALKRPAAPADHRVVESEMGVAVAVAKRGTLSSTCVACGAHVHLVQRILVDGSLYHRNCFRCKECSSTLLPGSYKPGSESGWLVCRHHFARANQNGRPDLSKRVGPPVGPAPPETPPSGRSLERTPATGATPSPQPTGQSDSLEKEREERQREEERERDEKEREEREGDEDEKEGGEREREERERDEQEREKEREEEEERREEEEERQSDCVQQMGVEGVGLDTGSHKEEEEETGAKGEGLEETKVPPLTPPNPFDDTDEEDEEEKTPKPANGDLPPTPVSCFHDSRPVPAPRRVTEPAPPPRPAPRARLPRVTDSPTANGDADDCRRSVPMPREKSYSPGSSSQSSHTPKPKDPPWLALVQSEPKRKPAPPPPLTSSVDTSPCPTPSLKGTGSRPATPPPPTNPFEEEEEEEEEEDPGLAPPSVVTAHPWYSITLAADADTPPGTDGPAHSASPGSSRRTKRPAPRVPALSTESLGSSSSELGVSRASPGSGVDSAFTKSISEPSISTGPSPADPQSRPLLSPSPSPPPPPTNTSSAPPTPQTNRSAGKAPRPPPPRPATTPSPLTTPPPLPPSKRTCKENPFNRKAPPCSSSKPRPPKGPRPDRPPAPGHGFPLIKRRVQSDQYIPVEDIHVEMGELERQLDALEQRGVDLEKHLRDCSNDEEEERMLVDWFTLIHEKHLLVRREAELVYTAKQQNLEERQADVEYELRCLLNKPEKEWSDQDRSREKQLMAELVTIIEQRNHIITSMDQDRQREEEEDKLVAAMLKKKDFHGENEQKKKAKFKPMKVLKRLSQKNERSEGGKGGSPRKEKS